MKKLLLIAACVVGMGMSQVARGDLILSFSRITASGGYDVSGQLSVEVSYDNDWFYFLFKNTGKTGSTINEIYFDDGLLPPAVFDAARSSLGVSFTENDVRPGDLPSGNNVDFVANKFLSSEPVTNVANGVDPGEYAMIKFARGEGTFADWSALVTALTTEVTETGEDYPQPSLWIGMHVTRIDGADATGKYSDAYVHGVPDGGLTAAMLGLGVLGVGYMARRKS